jgi:VanZ family protein
MNDKITAKMETANDVQKWNLKAWLWALLCTAGIYATVPVARRIQTFVYETAGKYFFTYGVLFIVCSLSGALLYFFIVRLKVKKASQYLWLLLCTGIYVYLTIQLKAYPEEAVHLLEYSVLSYLVFNALSHKIRDWTVYLTTFFFVLFLGTADEFIQWMMPGRYWGIKDIGINAAGCALCMITLWKGVNPQKINQRTTSFSVAMLIRAITVSILFIGLCLSNTPAVVMGYTELFSGLSWLRNEEPMSLLGFGNTGTISQSFDLRTVWISTVVILAAVWTGGTFWKRKINGG